MPLIVSILSLINISTCPLKDSFAVPLVFEVLPLISIAARLSWASPFTKTVFHSIFKLTGINLTLLPSVLALAVSLALLVLTGVYVTRAKSVRASPLFEAEVPFSFVSVPVWPGMDSIPVCSWFVPFTIVRVILDPFPYTVSVLQPMVPFPVVNFAVGPGVHSFSMRLSFLELAIIRVIVCVSLKAFAISQVIHPWSLVLSATLVLHGSFAVSLSLNHLTDEDGLSILAFSIIRKCFETFKFQFV